MIKKLLLAISFIIFFSSANAEIIKKIIIDGNKRVSDETVKVYGNFSLNKNFSEEDVNNVLKDLYSTNFFENVEVTFKNNILTIGLKEYPLINQLIITGEPKNRYREDIKKVIQSKEKRAFIKSRLVKDIDIIKSLYSSLGYNFAKVEIKTKKLDQDNLDLLISLDKGEQTKISSINFVGNKNIRSKRLKEVVASEEDKFWKVITRNTNLSKDLIQLDQRLLFNYYKSLGYYDIKTSSNIAEINKEGNANLIYTVEEGKRYTFKKISTKVDPIFDKKLFFPLNKIYKKYIGDYYSPFKIKKLLEEIDTLIESNNLQFVEHNVQEDISGDSINVTFNIFEGDKKLVERINITGNNITAENVIRGELILDEGDPFINLNLEKSIAKIKARNLFKEVDYNVVNGSKDNLKVININVEEKATGEISAGAGIGTSGSSIGFDIKENNWLGQGKNIGFSIQASKESLKGRLNYSNPNYDFLGNSLNYNFSSETNDKPDQGFKNSIISAGVGTSFEQYKDVSVNLGLSSSIDNLKTTDTASASLKKQEGTFTELAANYGFSIDKRDRAFAPTDGSIISFRQSLPIYADKSFIGNTLTTSIYRPFGENVVGATKMLLSSVNGLADDHVRLSKRKFLSTRRLRGFEQGKVGPTDGLDHIGGNFAAALNFETTLPNLLPENLNTDLGFFLDVGNVWGVDYDKSIDDSNKVRSSAGANVSWVSPIGPMSFVFSQNLSKASTDKTESFSFNLGTTF